MKIAMAIGHTTPFLKFGAKVSSSSDVNHTM